MDEIIAALIEGGYLVDFAPGWRDSNTGQWLSGGCTAIIRSRQNVREPFNKEEWSAHGQTPEIALRFAVIGLRDHMRPAYTAYLDIAKLMKWEQ